ncbi:MAG: hypothetical protein ABH803_01410 [Candidatus Micrarchaeota archaeon]
MKKLFLLVLFSLFFIGCTFQLISPETPEPTNASPTPSTDLSLPEPISPDSIPVCSEMLVSLSSTSDFSFYSNELLICSDYTAHYSVGITEQEVSLNETQRERLDYLIDHVEFRNINLNTQKEALDGKNYQLNYSFYSFDFREADYLPRNLQDLVDFLIELKA